MGEARSRRRRDASSPLPRAWALPIAGAWLLVCVVLGVMLARAGSPAISGDVDGLVPIAHRLPHGEPLVLLRIDDSRMAEEGSAEEALLNAAKRIGDRLTSERVPLAPPAAEVTAWLDTHALYLLPSEAHEELRAALSEAAMQDAVDGLKGRLSSPMFGVTAEQPRRDPLALSRLTEKSAGQLGRLSEPGANGPRATASGDLLAQDGRALLIQLQSQRALPALERDVVDAIADLPVVAAVMGEIVDQAHAESTLRSHTGRLAIVTLAGLTAVLAIALRSVRAVLAIAACIASAVAAFIVLGPPLSILSLPLVVLLAGFGCEGALHLQRISSRGWPAAGVLGTALLPLLLSPYPEWREWSWRWLLGFAAIVVVLRLMLPVLVGIVGGASSWQQRGFLLRPARVLAVVLSVAALGGGAWAVDRLPFRGLEQPLVEPDAETLRVLRDRFFDPRKIAEAETLGRDATDAVTRAATDARALAELVPDRASRVDSPGAFVLPAAELQRRRDALTTLDLDERMDVLFDLLTTRGFRPDAFGEFVRSASDLDTLPTPQSALEGPLGPWIERYLVERDDTTALRNRVLLRGDSSTAEPEIERESGPPIELRGPAIAARRDRTLFSDWLGVYVALQLWLGALAVWLGTRSLAVALGATVAALTAQTALLATMVPLRLAIGPEIIPALLLVGAAALVAGGRACRAVELQRPFYATGLLVTGLCQVAAGLALLSTGEPAWARVGWLIAIGAAIASGTGLFIAPGVAKLLRPTFGDHDDDVPEPASLDSTEVAAEPNEEDDDAGST